MAGDTWAFWRKSLDCHGGANLLCNLPAMNLRRLAAPLLLLAGCRSEPNQQGGSSLSATQATLSAAVHAASAPSATVKTPSAKPGAPLVVALVVDQLGAWVLRQRLASLPPDGGFARLTREGTYVKEIAYAHSITETAPGHASLFTGMTPHDHGIVANDVLDPEGKRRPSIGDNGKKKIALTGPVEGMGTSLAALRQPVVADHFRERYGKSGYIAALSMKDRGAVFGAGKSADLAIWFDAELGTFVTSDAWNSQLPSSLKALIEPSAISQLEAEPWEPLDTSWIKAHASLPDRAPGEGDLDGFGAAFPHLASQAKKPGAAFRSEPRSDRLLLEMGLKVLDAEAAGRPTFLSISLSANDYIGHIFGPDSWEAWDELRRLDHSLGWFFGELDRRFGAQGWAAVLSGDHGIGSLPEKKGRGTCGKDPLESHSPCGTGHRVIGAQLEARARAAAKTALNDATAILGVVDPYVYLSATARGLDGKARKDLTRVLEQELKGVPGVAQIVDVRTVPAHCPEVQDESLSALVCRSIHPGSGGDFYVVLTPGSFFDTGLVKEAGTSHGSPYGYDRLVPLFVRNPNRPGTAGKVDDTQHSFVEYHDSLLRIIDGV